MAALAVLTAAVSAYRGAALVQSVAECNSLVEFSEGFYTSHTVYKISLLVFAVLSCLALLFANNRKTFAISRADGRGSRVAALICGIGIAACSVQAIGGSVAELGRSSLGMLGFGRIVCALLMISCAIYFINIYFGFLGEKRTWIFALGLPVWAMLAIVMKYFSTDIAYNNPIRVSGSVAFAAVVLFTLFEARAELAYPCGRLYMAMLCALPCVAAMHIIPIAIAFLPVIGSGEVSSISMILSDMVLLPLLVYMTARSYSMIKTVFENKK